MTELLDDLIAFFEARNTGNATNEFLNRCKEEKKKQLLIHGVSKSFASGAKVQITHCIKGHEFEIGEFAEIVDYHEDDLWLAKSLERSKQQWYINEEEANVC